MVATLTNVARILGRDGNETITGSQDDDRILGRKGEDSLFGVGGNDTMTGGEDADLIDGGDGDDLFEIEDDDGAGDTFVGGAGTDTIVNTDARHDFDLANAQFHGVEVIDGNGGEIRVGRDGVLDLSSVGTLTDVERIRGASGDETIIGTGGDDLILGDRGADVLGGGAGNDTIDGGYHADRMEGGDGDDVFTIGGKHGVGDTFVGGDGQDVIRNTKQDQSFHLTGAVFDGIEEINGNGGEIRVGRDGVLDLSSVAVLTDVAGIRGNSGNETITGSQGDDVIDGENGFDTVIVPGTVVDFDIEVLDTRHDHDHGNGHRHDDTHVIVSGPDTGTDTLLDIEQIVFDDYTLYLDGRNNAPIIRADAFGTDEDTALLLTYADLLANDYDPDGDPFGITSVSSADVAVLFDAAGGITLDPRGLYDTLAQGAYQDVTATYTTADAHGAVGSGKISLVITGVNDAPVANSDSGETTEQIIATGNVLGNDTDVDDGATLRITAVNGQPITTPITLASGAIVVMTSKGDFAYDPGDNFASVSLGRTTTDSFVYTLRDEHDAESEATVSIVIHGDNDPVSDSDESYAVEAAGALTVSAAEGLLAPGNAFDIDAHDVLRIVDADGVTPFLGDNGGTFYINADGSFSIDTGTDFNGLDRGATLTTSVTYRVTDGNGSFDTSTLSLVVTGSRFDPFTEDEPRFDEEFGPDDWAALQPILVEGTFEQLGGVDVATELFSDLVGAEVDLATIFDFTFLNVDKTISFVSLPGNAFDVTVTDNGSETPLPGFDSAIESLEGVAGRFLPLDLGPVTVKPTFDLDIELDINFGIDVDLPTLGKTAFFQPIQLTLLAPTEVAANQAFILTSGDLTSLSPETVMETIGLGSFAINSAFSIADSTISQLGYEVASSNVDAIGLELDGLAGQSLTFNAELRLGDIVEQTKEFVRAIVEDVTGVFGQVLPFDPEEVFDTLMSLDVTKVVSNIITGVVDFEALIERVQSSDAATALTAVGDLVSALLQEPEDPAPLAKIDVDGVEGAATAVELYDLFRRGLFNEFDRFDENNVGLFTLPVVDDAGAPTGATVEVTAQQVIDTMDLLGIPDRIESAVDALGGATFSPFDGIEVTFAMPVGNLDIIDGFGEDSAGVPITAPQTGTHSITVTQETALVSTSIDFEAVALSLVDALLDATADSSPQARALQTYLGVATQLAAAAEQGIIAELELDPAKLVQTAVNGAVDALNAAGDAIDSIIPGGDTFADIPSIGEADTLEAIDAFIDTTVGAFTRAFDMVSDLIEGVADFLGQFLSGGAMTLNAIADILGVATGLVGDAIQGAINTLNSVADFGITIPLLVTEIEIYPFRDIVQVPIDLLNGLKSGVDAANRGVDAIGDFADEIQTAANALTDFEMGDEVQRGLEDFADFLKDLTRGAYLGAELQADILEATMDASLSVVQEATFDPNEVTVDYAIGGFEIGTDLDKAVGIYALGGAGDQITGTATYNFSGNVDYEYSLKLDLDPHFQFLETTILGQLLVGDSINESFSEDLTLIEVRDKETSADLPDDGEERLVDLQFNFTAAVTQAVEDAFAASLGTLVPTDLDLGDGDVFLFRVEDVDLGEDRFLPITQDFTVDLL
ncbi:Ig-like domain-containing protein [Puniceibacterium confluentis]|uniref:Ig-like domain-containing protein n=1 Tax=Puniceibacterium confluentis TaxID=1958944 RepID=UPI003563F49F